jgi:ABC-type nitrate/sulfonate/bicarbonate transport system substrate-binding protein
LRGSGQSAQAIIGGSILGAPCTLTTVMGANLSGADLVTVAHTVSGVQSKLLVRQDIKKPDDLRGKRIAVSGFGSLGDFLERYIIKKHGMDPVKDVILLSIGNQPDRLQALYNGVVDAADLSHPADVQAERKGYRVLWDAKKEVSYPSMSIVTRRKHTVDDRDSVMRMVKAHVEGIQLLKSNKELSLKVLSKYLKTNDRELLEGSYEITASLLYRSPTQSPKACSQLMNTLRNSAPTCGITSRKRLWMGASSPNWKKPASYKTWRRVFDNLKNHRQGV